MDIDAKKEEVMDYTGLKDVNEWPEIPKTNLPFGYILPKEPSQNDTSLIDSSKDLLDRFKEDDTDSTLRYACCKTPDLNDVPELTMDFDMPRNETRTARWRDFGIESPEPEDYKLDRNAPAVPKETTEMSALVPRSLAKNNGAPAPSTETTEMSLAISHTLPMRTKAAAIKQSRKRKQRHPKGHRGKTETYEPTPEGRARADHVDHWRTMMRMANDKKRRVVQKQSEEEKKGPVLQGSEAHGNENEKHDDDEAEDEDEQ